MKTFTTVELEICESTNDEAWKYPPSTLVIADRQTKGRGRQGRVWESGPASNLTMSLHLPVSQKNLSQTLLWVPLAAGVAAMESLVLAVDFASAPNLQPLHLKWPNDLYFADSKLGGILCESRISGENCAGVVVGIGINLTSSPDLPDIKTASFLKDVLKQGVSSPTQLTAMRGFIARSWALRLLEWSDELAAGRTEGLRAIWKKWAKLQEFTHLTTHDESGALIHIEAQDLDETGNLIFLTLGTPRG
jgi:biotin-[acetyl-CoA-carboxylase] ligase BirA-like protein